MKKLVILFLFMAATVQAQDGKHEKIKALKTAYITEALALTPAEAEKFWPIYNSYHDKFHALRVKERNEIFEKLREGLNKLTDAEANDLIDKNLAIESGKVQLRKQMTAELRKVISPKKIISLKKAEDDFKRELFERYRQSHEKRKD
ncbi:sensor of ECF-type sigma factor [Aequorivita sp. F47161]|uniref:Sensor of ECF-type sigma factor n=1 Tax=Aequorivita vitellina TaxID=2874475 RepID=A0A9X1QWF8_9FLAO|nr:sensor of ECF-type sigma factor [Aequorivita vitellina]MCG2417869.1 sensor of ECF-type sigma factor [Aequorivita vitellina]MCZ4318324.1 sensor of ECF-type sigma factor [Aequorivita viscosa]